MESLVQSASTQQNTVTASPESVGCSVHKDHLQGIFSSTIDMPQGLPGFPSAGRFVLEPLAADGSQLLRLRSLNNEDLAFLVLPIPDQMPVIAEHDLDFACRSQEFDPAHVIVFLIVTVEQTERGIRLFANLRAPLLIDPQSKQGAQVVLQSPGYPLRYALQAA